MGKPKALRNRDVLPTITLDKVSARNALLMSYLISYNCFQLLLQKPNKRTNFDADPEEDAGNQVVDAVVKKGGKVAEAVVDEPEEIAADSAEVLRMKELHESMVESYTRKSKRRKITLAPTSTADADTKLDNDVFAAFGDESGDENSSDEEDAASDDGTGWTIDVRKSNSRKM